VRLEGKAALITGASRNIGRAIALAFAAEGAVLVLTTRANRDELEAVGAECAKAGARVVTVLGDIADPAAVEAMVKQGIAEFGAVDALVCNAAIRPHKGLMETSLED
jgi:3-oxoacyl-[acyl-carrier protein] reductase